VCAFAGAGLPYLNIFPEYWVTVPFYYYTQQLWIRVLLGQEAASLSCFETSASNIAQRLT
jgi:hypothetical protein